MARARLCHRAGCRRDRGQGRLRQKQEEDSAMNLDRVDTVVAGVDSVLHLPDGRVEKPLAQRHYAVRDGVLVALDSSRCWSSTVVPAWNPAT
jgi:hypothetical protein